MSRASTPKATNDALPWRLRRESSILQLEVQKVSLGRKVTSLEIRRDVSVPNSEITVNSRVLIQIKICTALPHAIRGIPKTIWPLRVRLQGVYGKIYEFKD